jgi:hypothetical protein
MLKALSLAGKGRSENPVTRVKQVKGGVRVVWLRIVVLDDEWPCSWRPT